MRINLAILYIAQQWFANISKNVPVVVMDQQPSSTANISRVTYKRKYCSLLRKHSKSISRRRDRDSFSGMIISKIIDLHSRIAKKIAPTKMQARKSMQVIIKI